MDFFQHRYYKLTKTLMTIAGQWPYQSTRARRGCLLVIIIFSLTQVVPIVSALMKYRDDPKIQLDCVIIIVLFACSVTKLICFMWHSQTTLKLINRIRTDWQVWAGDREVYILHEYAEQGKLTILLYTAMMYSSLLVFMTQPMISKIIDVLLMNGTEPGKFPYPVEYSYINAQKYYFYIVTYSCAGACMMCTVSVASDVILVVYVQHGCGIFAALGCVHYYSTRGLRWLDRRHSDNQNRNSRALKCTDGHSRALVESHVPHRHSQRRQKLERIGNNVTSAETEETRYALEESDIAYVVSCIDRHKDAIEYANLIEAIYAWTFFFLIGFGMIQGTAIGLQVVMCLRKNDLKTAATLTIMASAGPVLFAIMSYLSQMLMDHSIIIRFHVHNSQWYRLSTKAQKLLQLMTMRCNVPCQLTVGKFFTMCMRTFAVTVRTTVSYFTIMHSMQ